MKIQKLMSLGFHQKDFANLEINPLQLTTDEAFREKCLYDNDRRYQDRAIDRCLTLKVPFQSEFNTLPYLMQRLISQVNCLYCKKTIPLRAGGGSASTYSFDATCECGARFYLSLGHDAVGVTPDWRKRD